MSDPAAQNGSVEPPLVSTAKAEPPKQAEAPQQQEAKVVSYEFQNKNLKFSKNYLIK